MHVNQYLGQEVTQSTSIMFNALEGTAAIKEHTQLVLASIFILLVFNATLTLCVRPNWFQAQ